jgi:hypothetical protein
MVPLPISLFFFLFHFLLTEAHHVIFVVHGMGRQLEVPFGNYEKNGKQQKKSLDPTGSLLQRQPSPRFAALLIFDLPPLLSLLSPLHWEN